jgi:hypothetical protein
MKNAIPILLAASALVACGAAGNASEPAPVSPYSGSVRACPLGVPETRVDVEDTPEGVEVVFRASEAHVVELQGRVANQAAEHGPDAHAGMGHHGKHGLSHDHGMRLWDLPPNTATVVDFVDGATLRIVALDPASRDDLRMRVRARVAHLESQDCP